MHPKDLTLLIGLTQTGSRAMITYLNYNIASSLSVSASQASFLEQRPAISQSSPEKLHQQDLYIERSVFQGIGSHYCGGWQV